MPLSKYFGGKGEKVMSSMKNQYGSDAQKVFYATVNKRKGLGPSNHFKKKKTEK